MYGDGDERRYTSGTDSKAGTDGGTDRKRLDCNRTDRAARSAGSSARQAEAVPEEIKEIVAKWPRVAGSAQQPMKSYLKNARLSLGGDDRLLLVVEDGLLFLKNRQIRAHWNNCWRS